MSHTQGSKTTHTIIYTRHHTQGTKTCRGALGRGLSRLVGRSGDAAGLAVDETVIVLHPPLPLVGKSIVMERERQQNDSLADG